MNRLSLDYRSLTSKLLISSLLVACTVAFAATAVAEDIIFDGTVTPSCSFDTASNTAGVLTVDGATLSSASGGGASGSVDLICNTTTSTVSIERIRDNNTNTADSTSVTVTGASGGTLTFNGSQVSTTVSQGITTLKVDMEANFTDVVPAGSYTYTIVLSASPN